MPRRATCAGCKMLRATMVYELPHRISIERAYCGLGGTITPGKKLGDATPKICPLKKITATAKKKGR